MMTTRELVKTVDVMVPGGPELRVEVFKERRGRFGLRCWTFELFQVEVPQVTKAALRRKPQKAHPTLLEEHAGFPFDWRKRYPTPAAALRGFVRAATKHFKPPR